MSILSDMWEKYVGTLRKREDYEPDAIHALVRADPRYTFEAWEAEVALGVVDEGRTFSDAVYTALVENFQELRDVEEQVFPLGKFL